MERPSEFDLFIIGGGVNGCGIARDAAGRGHRVGLAEMNDLASGTSNWSTKLIHGGLRYLEHYDFALVRHALQEREVLLRIAPHIIRPLRFVLPHHRALRPAWLLRAGLFLYDRLGGRQSLPRSTAVDLTGPLGAPLKGDFTKGFEYSDARVDDARLVVLNARDAAARGAAIMVGTAVVAARREGGLWRIDLLERESGARRTVSARALVNAAGPWIDAVNAEALAGERGSRVRLVQGSHIVTRKLYEHDRAYIFQNADGRIIFTIPYEQDFTLVGTTDRDYEGDPGKVAITQEEIDYLLAATGEYFQRPLRREDIVWTFSGVRPLYDDGAEKAQESSRDYVLKLERPQRAQAPILNIFGGKITTYRVLAEEALAEIEKAIGKPRAGLDHGWTARTPLPGGDIAGGDVSPIEAELGRLAPTLQASTIRRLAASYGTDALRIGADGALGPDLGHGLHAAEVDWLIDREWARSADDILWRRSKLGLLFTTSDRQRLEDYLAERVQPRAAFASGAPNRATAS